MVRRPTLHTPESCIQNACLEWLAWNHVLAWRANSGGMKVEDATRRRGYRYVQFSTAKGMSDICAIIGGRFFAIEVKSETGRTSPEQRAFLASVEAAGGVGLVVRSVEELAAGIAASGGL
jgi:hypothetical protein